MLIKTILEFNRTMWGLRCKIVADEKTATYESRQRMDIFRLSIYLKQNPHELPDSALHYLDKDDLFFYQSPLDNVLMWSRGSQTNITMPHIHRNKTLKRYFKPKKSKTKTTTKKKRSKVTHSPPSSTQRKRNDRSTHTSTTKNRKKEKISQSSIPRFFNPIPIPSTDSPSSPELDTPSLTLPAPTHKKLKKTKASEHILAYQHRLKAFQNTQMTINDTNPIEGFKRHNEVPPSQQPSSPSKKRNETVRS